MCPYFTILTKFSFPPDGVDHRKDDQHQQERGEQASDDRGGDPLHHISARSCAEKNRDQAQIGCNRHDLRPQPFDGAIHHSLSEVILCFQSTLVLPFLISKIKAEKHDDPRLCAYPPEGDHSHPCGCAHIVVEEIKKPEGADERKRDGQKYDHGLDDRACVEIDKDKDDQGRERDDEFQSLLSLHQILIFPAPFKPVAVRDFERGELFPSFTAITTDIPSCVVDVDIGEKG